MNSKEECRGNRRIVGIEIIGERCEGEVEKEIDILSPRSTAKTRIKAQDT